jgi:hypothetical protein
MKLDDYWIKQQIKKNVEYLLDNNMENARELGLFDRNLRISILAHRDLIELTTQHISKIITGMAMQDGCIEIHTIERFLKVLLIGYLRGYQQRSQEEHIR